VAEVDDWDTLPYVVERLVGRDGAAVWSSQQTGYEAGLGRALVFVVDIIRK
jgi:hypothetical protein